MTVTKGGREDGDCYFMQRSVVPLVKLGSTDYSARVVYSEVTLTEGGRMVVMSRSIGSMYPSLATKMRCIATVNSWKVRWPSPSMSDSFLERGKKNLYFPCGLGMRIDCTTLWHK